MNIYGKSGEKQLLQHALTLSILQVLLRIMGWRPQGWVSSYHREAPVSRWGPQVTCGGSRLQMGGPGCSKGSQVIDRNPRL